jgi:hypothetical protein
MNFGNGRDIRQWGREMKFGEKKPLRRLSSLKFLDVSCTALVETVIGSYFLTNKGLILMRITNSKAIFSIKRAYRSA